MSLLSPVELSVFADHNGLVVERDPVSLLLFLRRCSGGPRADVVVAAFGWIDLTATLRNVHRVCFQRGSAHAISAD